VANIVVFEFCKTKQRNELIRIRSKNMQAVASDAKTQNGKIVRTHDWFQSRTQSPQASCSAGGHRERLWGSAKKEFCDWVLTVTKLRSLRSLGTRLNWFSFGFTSNWLKSCANSF